MSGVKEGEKGEVRPSSGLDMKCDKIMYIHVGLWEGKQGSTHNLTLPHPVCSVALSTHTECEGSEEGRAENDGGCSESERGCDKGQWRE